MSDCKKNIGIRKQVRMDLLNTIPSDVAPKEPQIERIPYRVCKNTTIYVPASLSEEERRARVKEFCIKNKLGNYREFTKESAQ